LDIRIYKTEEINPQKLAKSENSTKTALKTNKILYIDENSKKKLQECNSQDIYKTLNIMNKNIKEHPTGFMKWRQKLGNTICIKDMLTFHHLKENKLKIFRWKLLHFILPCKQLLYQRKIENTPLCDTCHIVHLDNFWGLISSAL
jgi:hypothetical protein